MAKYIIKRIFLAIVTIFVICAITFFAMHAVPGGPFNSEKALSEATIAALEARYGLDKPVGEQFVNYLKQVIFNGDFGVSLKNGREISAIIGESFPISAKLGLMAMAVALVCGTVFGCIAALMRNKLPCHYFLLNSFHSGSELRSCNAFAPRFLYPARMVPGLERQLPKLPSPGDCACGISDGVHHPSRENEYA